MNKKISIISIVMLFLSIHLAANSNQLIGAKAVDQLLNPTIEEMQ